MSFFFLFLFLFTTTVACCRAHVNKASWCCVNGVVTHYDVSRVERWTGCMWWCSQRSALPLSALPARRSTGSLQQRRRPWTNNDSDDDDDVRRNHDQETAQMTMSTATATAKLWTATTTKTKTKTVWPTAEVEERCCQDDRRVQPFHASRSIRDSWQQSSLHHGHQRDCQRHRRDRVGRTNEGVE